MARMQIFVLLMGALLSLAAGSSTPTFCKCTCFKNSTIIPLSEDAGTIRRSLLIPSTDPDHLLSADRDTLVFDVAAEDSRHTSRDNNRHASGEDSRHTSRDDSRHTSGEDSRHTSRDDSRHTSGEDSRHTSRDDSRHTSGEDSRHTSGEDSRHTSRDRHTTGEDSRHTSRDDDIDANGEDSRHTSRSDIHTTRHAKRVPAACSACTKTFCRSHGLPICHDAEDDDVTTMCFQRDSATDRVIVWGFMLGTLGLLGWAAVRKVRAAREARRGRFGGGAGYSPLGQGS